VRDDKFSKNSLIIDYTNASFRITMEKIANEVLSPKQHVVRSEPIPTILFYPRCPLLRDANQKNSNDIASDRWSICSVFDIGNQNISVLHRAIMTV
jgi:hypothetical protein